MEKYETERTEKLPFLLDGTVAPLKETDSQPWTKQEGGGEKRIEKILNEWSNTLQTHSRAIWEDSDVNESENKTSERPPDDLHPFEPLTHPEMV